MNSNFFLKKGRLMRPRNIGAITNTKNKSVTVITLALKSTNNQILVRPVVRTRRDSNTTTVAG